MSKEPKILAWNGARGTLRCGGVYAWLSAAMLAVGCAAGSGDVEKAQIAVRANPALELVATDDRQGVLTVKVKRSGQVLTVKAGDVVAGTAFRDLDAAVAPANGLSTSVPPATGSAAAVSASSGPGSRQQVELTGHSGRTLSVAGSENGASLATGASGASGERVETPARPESSRRQVDSVGPGGQVSVTSSGKGLTVSTPDGRRVTVGGSGSQIDITTSEGRRDPSPDRRSSGSSSDGAGRGAAIDDSRLVRQTRPVSCKGASSVDLDGVLLKVADVAVESIGDCTVRIANSHIVGNIAVQGTGSTTMTVVNSVIEGRVAFKLTGDTNVTVQSSTVRGAVQKIGSARLRDLGGNLWQ